MMHTICPIRIFMVTFIVAYASFISFFGIIYIAYKSDIGYNGSQYHPLCKA